MFYEIMQELTKVRKNNTIYKEYGEDIYTLIYYYTKDKRDINDKQLSTINRIAKKLDVPAQFVINILKYEGVEELDKTRGTTIEAPRE